MSNKTEVWKKASEVYAEISELSPQQALAHVYGIENITLDVREAIITLINAGSQASQYYKDNISKGFNLGINNTQNFSVGQQLDEYELLEEIGHGGMSQVFKAKRINTQTQTQVAIKVFAPKDNSNELLNHFLNEQKILAGLSHHNIVKMLHSGQTDDNVTYLVMELIEGAQSLDSYCENNNLNTKQKIKYIAQCAHALAYSHANLIIHRDLKPDNILINQNGELKIVDFGIAKLINNDLSGNKTTIMALTPSYAAPEQINSEAISIKTDIFSLAVVALDLLTKESPLPKDRLIKSCANDEHHIDALFKRLKIDKDLKNILNKALEQEPDKRYSSMQSFADDLSNYLQDKPVNATAQSFFYRIQKFAKRRSALFATLVSFMAFMLIGSIVGYKQYQQIKQEAQKANQVKQFMIDAFEITDPKNAKGLMITAKDILDSAADKITYNEIDDGIKFSLLQTIGIAYQKIGEAEKASQFLRKSLEIKPSNSQSQAGLLSSLLDTENFEEFNSIYNQLNLDDFTFSEQSLIYRAKAIILISDIKHEQASIILDKALVASRKSKDDEAILVTQQKIAYLYAQQNQTKKAMETIKSALLETKLQQTNPVLMRVKYELERLRNRLGKYKEVIENLTALEKQQRNILGDFHPDLALTLGTLGDAYAEFGDLETAQLKSQESYDIYIKRYGQNSTKAAIILNSLAITQYQNGNLPKAIELLYKVVKVFEEKNFPDNTSLLAIKTNLASMLSADNRIEESIQISKEIYAERLEKNGPHNALTLFSQAILAKALAKTDQINQAIELAYDANQKAVKYLGLSHPKTADTFTVLGNVYQQNGDYTLALKAFLPLVEQNLHKPSSPRRPTSLALIAETYDKLNDVDNSKIYYLKAITSYTKIYSDTHKLTLLAQLRYAKFLKENDLNTLFDEQFNLIDKTIKKSNITDTKIMKELHNLKSNTTDLAKQSNLHRAN